ncbi:uncharacterized protein M421DRAFT_423259 [Didymella exigua CBS 183.55]|uniref:Rhodopsin domain-containing protein n=1 Tax=Didymella exigua CBS 183.55 TaxID=1150837 RepID=A0A6A5RK94_9PLEO|nr:uncharacterized protein M421DRAFT_423259 [Didymella exigua CBS 183.55]KAF1925977.1 hypothetical protein M421DRAFT_423259 [Didymella exigua CBS 183.55]
MPATSVELWTLYAFGVAVTLLRTYARVSAVGYRELRADDYLIWLALLLYTAQTILGYNVGIASHGLANNGMTDAQRSALSHDDPEYGWRVIGSKIQLAGWTTALCLLWTLKLCVAVFYYRLTSGLSTYQKRISVAMGFIATTFVVVVLTIFLSCRPLNHYWQISPNPGNSCQPAISKPIVWVTFVTNVSTDIFLFMIPVPMLWNSSLRLYKKVAATLVLSAGLLIIICATLKSIFVITDPIDGGALAAEWGTRETFVAVLTTNLPMIFPLLKIWLQPFLPSTLRSSSNKAYKTPGSGFVTIGGGGASSHANKSPWSGARISANINLDNESEERIIEENDIKMQHLHSPAESQRPQGGIIVSKHVSVTTEAFGKEGALRQV